METHFGVWGFTLEFGFDRLGFHFEVCGFTLGFRVSLKGLEIHFGVSLWSLGFEDSLWGLKNTLGFPYRICDLLLSRSKTAGVWDMEFEVSKNFLFGVWGLTSGLGFDLGFDLEFWD